LSFQQKLARPAAQVLDWSSGSDGEVSVMDIIRYARPCVLIGVSGQPGLFTREMVTQMAEYCDRPMTFPLSNPTSRVEATPKTRCDGLTGGHW
jgi:malate dehydrogenase (oxaloacetate-decarboxylating)